MAIAENAHPLNNTETVWHGMAWETAIVMAVEWRIRARDYAASSFEQYPNYDYSLLELV